MRTMAQEEYVCSALSLESFAVRKHEDVAVPINNLDDAIPALQGMDMDAARKAFPYTVALTCRDGMSDEHVDLFVTWHQHDPYFHQCLLVKEISDAGLPHLHALIDVLVKQTGGVTRKYERFYKQNHIPFEKGVSICVKRQTDRHGAVHYLIKDFAETGSDFLVKRAWKETWLQKIMKDLKRVPHWVLEKNQLMITKKNGVVRCLQFAKAHNMKLVGRMCFIDLCVAMCRDDYIFSNCSPEWLYCEVMLRMGYDAPFRSMWGNKLQFLD